MRLVCILAFDKHREAIVNSKLQATRPELDEKAVGAHSNFWTDVRVDFRNPDLEIPKIIEHPLVTDCDPMVLSQPNITAAKLSNMWANAKKEWNPLWGNYKSESGNHAPWSDFCRGKKDVYIVGAAVEKFPELHQVMTNLLPDNVQREDAGTGGAGSVAAEGGPDRRAEAKRAGQDLYVNTKGGQKKLLKAQREAAAAAVVSSAVTSAVSSVMSDVFMPALSQQAGGGENEHRARTDEAESMSASLALSQQQGSARRRWTEELRAEEALGERGDEWQKNWLKKQLKELQAAMMG
ncbi:unnamed protein product [Scytosiphon promiscuus]